MHVRVELRDDGSWGVEAQIFLGEFVMGRRFDTPKLAIGLTGIAAHDHPNRRSPSPEYAAAALAQSRILLSASVWSNPPPGLPAAIAER